MDSSPAKRRKTSPTTSIPNDAPTTPSRIPVARRGSQPLSGRPSFASPTKASIARHNPQLLNRPSSAGTGAERPRSREKSLQDVSAKTFGEALPMDELQNGSYVLEEHMQTVESITSTQENILPTVSTDHITARPTTPRSQSRPFGGGLPAKPRSRSRSPSKSPVKKAERVPLVQRGESMQDMPVDVNPFVKRGLRRSPILSQPEAEVPVEEVLANPFKVTGLRRSPVQSQAAKRSEPILTTPETRPTQSQPMETAKPFTTPPEIKRNVMNTAPVLAQPPEPLPMQSPFSVRKSGLRRSPPVGIHPVANIEQDVAVSFSIGQRTGSGSSPTTLESNKQPDMQSVFRPSGLRRSSPPPKTLGTMGQTHAQSVFHPSGSREFSPPTKPLAINDEVQAASRNSSLEMSLVAPKSLVDILLESSPNLEAHPNISNISTTPQEPIPSHTGLTPDEQLTGELEESMDPAQTVPEGGFQFPTQEKDVDESKFQSPTRKVRTVRALFGEVLPDIRLQDEVPRASSPIREITPSPTSVAADVRALNNEELSSNSRIAKPAHTSTAKVSESVVIEPPETIPRSSSLGLTSKPRRRSMRQSSSPSMTAAASRRSSRKRSNGPGTARRADPAEAEKLQALFNGGLHHEEPELPPTPVQRGLTDLLVTTPPTGIHRTPSKRGRRGAEFKSSPLKPREPAPTLPIKRQFEREPQKTKSQPAKRRKSARFLIPQDPHAAKKKARDDLMAQLQQLQADVSLANQENERLRIHSESRKRGEAAAPNPDELLAMLARAIEPEPMAASKPKASSIFKSINAFLPFRPKRKIASSPVSEKPIPSHLPIALDDPLPYLQAFSPLMYTSTITLSPLEQISPNSPIKQRPMLQKNTITASHPSGLFCTRLSMAVDTSDLSIAAIDILRIDMNAETELGTFVRARARSEGALGKEINVICWAMSRWIEVSIQRARFWCAVNQECKTPQGVAKILQRKKKRKRNEAAEDDAEGSEAPQWTRKQLLPHIGRSSMELSNKEVELIIEWKIGFDWTGEVESSISANARLPRSWQQADDRSSLAKIPSMFNKLVKEKGPLGAVRTTIGLLMPV